MLNYTKYQFTATFVRTNRLRTRILKAKNLENAKQSILEQGYQVPEDIIALPHDLPTEAQLSYAKNLGIKVNTNDTKEDLIVLIDKKLSYDSEPRQELIDYANGIGLFFSLYIGKKGLYNLIYNLSKSEDKYAFFVFSVYRHLSNDRRSNLSLHPHKAIIYRIARGAIANEKIRRSMDRYAGKDLRFFGSLIVNNQIYEGGSENTYAYKFTSEEVSKNFGTKKTRRVNLRKAEELKLNSEVDKIFGKIMTATIIILFILIMVLMW